MSKRATDPYAQRRMQAARARDAALQRLGTLRRGTVVGAAGLTAGLTALVWSLAPGHSLSSARAATHPSAAPQRSSSSSQPLPSMPPAQGAGALGLSGGGGSDNSQSVAPTPAPAPSPAASAPAPVPAPAPAPAQQTVVAGGS